MLRHNQTCFRIWLSFFLIVSVLQRRDGALSPNSQVFPSQALHDVKPDWNSRPEIREASANSSRHTTFPSGEFRWSGIEDDDTSWPVLTLGWRTILAMILLALAAALSSAGGIGGGALYVPIFNLLLDFDSNTSAALSSFTIFGGTLVNFVWYFFRKHPQICDKPLIDYDVALIFQPNVLLGISVGVLCNVMSPTWLVTALLIVTVTYMTFRSCSSAFRRWNAESSAERIFVAKPEEYEYIKLDGNCGLTSSNQLSRPITCPEQNEEGKVALQQPLLESERENYPLLESQRETYPQFPATKMAMLALIWLGFFAVQLVRGIAAAENLWNIEACGTAYWLITLSQLPLAFISTACIVYYFKKYSKLRNRRFLEERDVVDPRSLITLPVVALLAGLLGGMLGLGGGMIICPLLLEMGMHPQVTAATSNFMVFFSSSLSVVQYWFLGRIPLEYGLYSAAISLVFSVIGLQLIQKVIKRFGRVSLIVFSVSTVMGISAILMACFGSLDIWSEVQQGANMGFSSPC